VVKISFPLKAPSIIDTIPVLVLVILIVSVPFGKVSVPFPDTTTWKMSLIYWGLAFEFFLFLVDWLR
jgi:hypothetical protein